MRKTQKIAFIIFNTLDGKSKLFLENLETNLEMNLWSGFLLEKNIKNEILFFLLSTEKENNRNLPYLIDYCKKEKYDSIFISTDCPSGMVEIIKKELSRKVYYMSDIEKILHFHPNFYNQFNPNFKYKFFGTKKPPILKTACLFFYGCPYPKTLKNNYFYQSLNLKKWKGCSYCSSALSYKTISVRNIKKQIGILKKLLPHLKLIEVPAPLSKDFISIIRILLKKTNLTSLSFYVFFRPDDLISNKEKIESLLKIMIKKKCSFIIENLGLENFSKKELTVLNRGYNPEINLEALKIFSYFKNKYPKAWKTERATASFILFEPFTDIEDLKLNIAQIAEFKKYFSIFNRISFNKLRMSKDTPIHYLAKKAGLISKPASNLNYRFQNPKIEKIYKTYKKLLNVPLINNQNQRVLSALTESLKLIGGF